MDDHMTRVKICGITRKKDAQLATDLGAWALGFILWPGSKRHIKLEDAKNLIESLPKKPRKLVAVVVNPSEEEIKHIQEAQCFTTIQLHGDETPTFARKVTIEVIKAFRIKNEEDTRDMPLFKAAFHLVDSKVEGTYGGTGHTIDWQLAKRSKTQVPLILSGGLNPTNISEALKAVEPYALDLSSGVEISPGIKSAELLEELFNQVAFQNSTANKL